jgi:Type I phosphodiesterase / nucleotide pyrophosphatase
MHRVKTRVAAAVFALAVTVPFWASTAPAQAAGGPNRVLIVLFDQMIPRYADQFSMPNFRALRGQGTYFKNAYLGYMASETVISHNVIVSGQLPANQGWVDEAYRDTQNIIGPTYANASATPPVPPTPVGAMHITGDFGQTQFNALVTAEGYPKLQDYLHRGDVNKQFIVVGEKSYAVRSAIASTVNAGVSATNLIAVHLSSARSASTAGTLPGTAGCVAGVGGTYRQPNGFNVPRELFEAGGATTAACGRFVINADGETNAYGTTDAFPSWLYPEEGNRFFPGTDASAKAGHLGGDVWATDAAITMMQTQDWSGMFVTLGGIDKSAHMWGAQHDADTFMGNCNAADDALRGANQTHVRCAAEIADAQLGKLRTAVAAYDAAHGGETLIVLTADHGATYGKNFYGKRGLRDGDSNWYYGPSVYDGGVPAGDFYNHPSPALQPLLDTHNVQFSYQSTAIEAWLTDHSLSKSQQAASIMQTLPGVMAAYYRNGNHFVLSGVNKTPASEKAWWQVHGQELVDTLISDNGPDVVGLLHDRVGYGAYGDHGGAQQSVQRVPVVFWSPSLAAQKVSQASFRTVDILPTILAALGITPDPHSMDGTAKSLT